MYLNDQEVAALFQIPVSTVNVLRRTRGLPHVWVGKHCRYVRDEIERWLKKNQGN